MNTQNQNGTILSGLWNSVMLQTPISLDEYVLRRTITRIYNPQVWIDDDNIGHYKTTQSLRAKQSCETCKFTKKKPNICRKCKISDKRNNQSNYQRDTSIVVKFRELW